MAKTKLYLKQDESSVGWSGTPGGSPWSGLDEANPVLGTASMSYDFTGDAAGSLPGPSYVASIIVRMSKGGAQPTIGIDSVVLKWTGSTTHSGMDIIAYLLAEGITNPSGEQTVDLTEGDIDGQFSLQMSPSGLIHGHPGKIAIPDWAGGGRHVVKYGGTVWGGGEPTGRPFGYTMVGIMNTINAPPAPVYITPRSPDPPYNNLWTGDLVQYWRMQDFGSSFVDFNGDLGISPETADSSPYNSTGVPEDFLGNTWEEITQEDAFAQGYVWPGEDPIAPANGNSGSVSLVISEVYFEITFHPVISPVAGSPLGGNTVTIYGADFVSGMTVTFDGVSATNVVVVDGHTLTCVVPAHDALGEIYVDVTYPNGHLPLPPDGDPPLIYKYTLLAIDLNNGPIHGGDGVTITGEDFVPDMSVRFGTVEDGAYATDVTFIDEHHLTAVTPAHVIGDVVVTLDWPAPIDETETIPVFTYTPFISPPSGSPKGDEPFIIGWADLVAGSAIRFAGALATEIQLLTIDPFTGEPELTGKYLRGKTPKHRSEVVDVVITPPTGDAKLLPKAYAFRMVVMPSSGRPGDLVTITSAGFIDGTTVYFDNVLADGILIVDDTHLTCYAPSHIPGLVGVTISIPIVAPATAPSVELATNAFLYTQNKRVPVLHMGPPQTAKGPLPSVIKTRVTMDGGLGSVSFVWTQLSGPTATVGTPNAMNTKITFNEFTPGVAVFQLVASSNEDPTLTATGKLSITVSAARVPRVTITTDTLQI
jgi:hypothetical protein